MSYIKQPHYTMNGLNLPAPGMDVLHTTVAYPCEYELKKICFVLTFNIFVLGCPGILESGFYEMVRKDAQAVRNAVENEGRINLLFCKTTCIDEIKRIITMIAGQTYGNHHDTC